VIDWFYTAPKHVTIIAAGLKGVLHDEEQVDSFTMGATLACSRPQQGVIRA